ncbi:DUF3990 domain-containing protein [Eggerthella sp. YY7918]|uniref:DUF3990 domain-containing protein n=1 Tax=Eggerthella sp. (strain YY7918) TaxID=502558 RepID=UPI00021717DA|nr:DUF3990 domain-containing protein [Eggerthella sp. YY7918]BAK45632.1 sortase [Eggerthella sp. YY7918]
MDEFPKIENAQKITLFHGSRVRVEQPQYGAGNPFNDYGRGFYCTEFRQLACEWACPTTSDGYVNEYLLSTEGLQILDLDSLEDAGLRWLATLVAHRRFDATTPLMAQAKQFMLDQYEMPLDGFDVVVGYRADDSYFSFARAFLDNMISLSQLQRALRLGNLGRQVMVRSQKAFDALMFVGAEAVEGELWHTHRVARDERARRAYRDMATTETLSEDDIFMLDLLRGA